MPTPYRNEIEALRERKAALQDEVAQVEGLIEETTRRAKRVLDVVQVASPCSAKWDEMHGDDRVRFCFSCEKNVYNLSAMPRDEAERFVQQNAAGEVCIRFYERADGTLMTADCPVGQKRKRRRRLALAVAGAGALGVSALTMVKQNQRMGEMRPLPVTTVEIESPPVVPAPTLPPAPPDPTIRHFQGGMKAMPLNAPKR